MEHIKYPGTKEWIKFNFLTATNNNDNFYVNATHTGDPNDLTLT